MTWGNDMRTKVIAYISAAALLALSVPAQERDEDSTNGRRDIRRTSDEPAKRDRGTKTHLRAFLRKHPRLFDELKADADQDGNGRLSQEERILFLEKAHEWMVKAREERKASGQS